MDRLKNTLYLAGMIGVSAAITFVTLVFIGGALAIAGIVLAALVLVGGVMTLFGKKKPFSGAEGPLTVVYTRIEDRDPKDNNPRR